MKKKVLLLLSIVSLSMYALNAQIENEIRSYADSTTFLVNNGRKLFSEKIRNRDYEKAREIYSYLEKITINQENSAFTYIEDILISFLFMDWDRMVDDMWFAQERNIKALNDDAPAVLPAVMEMIPIEIDIIEKDAAGFEIDEESKLIIDMIIYYFRKGADDHYKQLYRSFQKEHTDSRYEYFLVVLMPDVPFKGSFSLTMGSGMVFPQEELSEDFRNSPIFTMSLDFNVEKVYSSLHLQVSRMKLKNPLLLNHLGDNYNLEPGEDFVLTYGGLNLGYFLVRNDHFHIPPFVGFGGSVLESDLYEENDDRDEYRILSSFSTGFGLHTELFLFKYATPNFYYGGTDNYYLSLKFEPGYDFLFNYKDSRYSGNMPYFKIGLVWGFGTF